MALNAKLPRFVLASAASKWIGLTGAGTTKLESQWVRLLGISEWHCLLHSFQGGPHLLDERRKPGYKGRVWHCCQQGEALSPSRSYGTEHRMQFVKLSRYKTALDITDYPRKRQ
jgi:hypothetical protein